MGFLGSVGKSPRRLLAGFIVPMLTLTIPSQGIGGRDMVSEETMDGVLGYIGDIIWLAIDFGIQMLIWFI